MIRFKDLDSAYELRLLHATLYGLLRWIVEEVAWEQATGEPDLIVTEVWRSRAETIRIYEAAGLVPPAVSVHELTKEMGDPWSGCRGLDLSIRRPGIGPYESWRVIPDAQVLAFVALVNGAWRYQASEAHQVALFHDVSGPHVHLQVARGDETKRRPR